MTNESELRARHAALTELISELGPRPEWIQELAELEVRHEELTNGHAVNGHAPPPAPPPPPPPPSRPPRAAVPVNADVRPAITIGENMDEVARQVLTFWGSRYCVFQAGGRLFEIQTSAEDQIEFLTREPDSPRTVLVSKTRARALASRECRFFSPRKKGGDVEIIPPDWLGATVIERTDFPNIPVLAALAQAPTLRRDGALISESGYDASTGIYLISDIKVTIMENPTQEDAQQATAALLDLLCDFDFTNPAAKSVWLAGLLSVCCRHTFSGPAPLFIIDASKRGSGKTRLVDMISLIATGHSAPRMIYVSNDIEMDKRITSLGLEGDQLVLLDNIVGKLSSPSLDMVLTCDSYKGRILQKSKMTSAMPMKMVWFATGNGMTIGADTARRALLARLEPPVDHPEYRTGPAPDKKWKYTLPDYCLTRRATLLGHALTIVSAYIRAGKPQVLLDKVGSLEMGSYEKWSAIIRSAIVWAGAPDPCATVKDAHAADLENIALRTMVECWPAGNGVLITTAALIKQAEVSFGEPNAAAKEQWKNALLEWLPAKPGSVLPTARDLGYALRSIKGSIIGHWKIEAEEHTVNGIPWKRVLIGEAPKSDEKTTPKSTPNLVSV